MKINNILLASVAYLSTQCVVPIKQIDNPVNSYRFQNSFEDKVEKEFRKHGHWVEEFIRDSYNDFNKPVSIRLNPEIGAKMQIYNSGNRMIAGFDPNTRTLVLNKSEEDLTIDSIDHELWHVVDYFIGLGQIEGPSQKELKEYADKVLLRQELKKIKDDINFARVIENFHGQYAQYVPYIELVKKSIMEFKKLESIDKEKYKKDTGSKILNDFRERKEKLRGRFSEYAAIVNPLINEIGQIDSLSTKEEKIKRVQDLESKLERSKEKIKAGLEIARDFSKLEYKHAILGCMAIPTDLERLKSREEQDDGTKIMIELLESTRQICDLRVPKPIVNVLNNRIF